MICSACGKEFFEPEKWYNVERTEYDEDNVYKELLCDPCMDDVVKQLQEDKIEDFIVTARYDDKEET